MYNYGIWMIQSGAYQRGDGQSMGIRFQANVVLTRFALLMSGCAIACAAPPATAPIDLGQAKAAFAEAKVASDKEGGRLWGKKLYGGLFFVDPESRAVVANEPDPAGILHAANGVYVGTLPKEIIISNAPCGRARQRFRALASRREAHGSRPEHHFRTIVRLYVGATLRAAAR
jgi:hypothetical protein